MRLLLFIVVFLFQLSSEDVERLEWNENRPLTWSDFKGTRDSLQDWAASSSTGMSQSFQIDSNGHLHKNSVDINAYFYPYHSWVQSSMKSERLLAHEQTHFNITELYARKLAQEIDETYFSNNSAAEIKALYSKIEAERVEAQRLFDLDSNHSLNAEEEIKWEQKIKKLLSDSI